MIIYAAEGISLILTAPSSFLFTYCPELVKKQHETERNIVAVCFHLRLYDVVLRLRYIINQFMLFNVSCLCFAFIMLFAISVSCLIRHLVW